MCALGAEFRHENRKAITLFWLSRKLLSRATDGLDAESEEISQHRTGQAGQTPHRNAVLVRKARCMLLLIAFATWQKEADIAREAFELQSSLARCIRECHLEEVEQPHNDNWLSWVQQEMERRLKLFSFAFLNIHSIAFGTPPVILSEEIKLRLPCSCLEWIAPNQEKWRLVRRQVRQEQMLFQDALDLVMKNLDEPLLSTTQLVPSPLANYILLHAVIQQIILVYHALGPYNDVDSSLINGQKNIMR